MGRQFIIAHASSPLTALSEAQRAQALHRFTIIRPALDKEITQAQVARTHQLSLHTIQRWIKRYREQGLAGLADAARSDKGTPRRLPQTAIQLIEGLALQTPPRSAAAIHRQVSAIAKEQGWKPPSYARVRQIIKQLDPALVTLAHEGADAYREEFELLHRREATHANAMWQADHTPLDIWLLDEAGKPAKPWLTVIEDDYSRAISGFPSVFYTDHGSDFTSRHMEQVAADLGIELIFSEKGVPRGRGKIERFFRSVTELLLQELPGYAPEGYRAVEAKLTLPAFEEHFRIWLLEDYHQRVHSETKCIPHERWEAGGFLPRMPDSQEELDLLLLTVAKSRRVQQDGIRFQGHSYIDAGLSDYVKEEVLIRYDPADMAEIRVFYQDRFLCRAICTELSGQTISLKEIEKARAARRKQVKATLSERQAVVEQFIAVHQEEAAKVRESEPEKTPARARLKRYVNE